MAPRILIPTGEKAARTAASLDPIGVARDYLRRTARIDSARLRLIGQSEFGRGTILDFQAAAAGVPVFEGVWKAVVDENGMVAAATAPPDVPLYVDPAEPALSAEAAVRAAFRGVNVAPPAALARVRHGVAPHAFANAAGLETILADLTAFPIDGVSARLAWRIFLEPEAGAWYEILVDSGNGRILFRHDLRRNAGNARVWKIAPNKGDREAVTFPDSWLAAGVNVTTGNNADAYLDTNGDNQPDSAGIVAGIANGRASGTSGVFEFPAPDPNATQDPRTFAAAAVTNAFYFANVAHDYFYGLGFNESAGNFQTSNGDRGGRGGDAVRVEVHDRFNTNSAGFFAAPEGVAPRLELGIFTFGTASRSDDRDSAYQGQIVVHEYTHGVSSRLLGSGTGTSCTAGVQSGALDEGFADYFASSFFGDPVLGSYVSNNSERGLRRASLERYRLTYEDLGNEGFQVHRDGEIWAATLWEIRTLLGANVTDRLAYNALRLMPCRPTYIDARDAILAADRALNNGNNRARLFQVFAAHGMGASASAVDGLGQSSTVFNAAFDLPQDLQSGNRAPVVSSRPSATAVAQQPFAYQIEARDPDGGTVRYELLTGPQGLTVDAGGLVRWTPTFASERVKILITDGQGGRVIHGFSILVITQLTAGRAVTTAAGPGQVGLATIEVPERTPVLQLMLRSGNGSPEMVAIGPDGSIDFDIQRPGQTKTLSIAAPAPGTWFLGVASPIGFQGVQLTAVLPEPRVVGGNTTVQGLNGEPTSETFFRIIVPPGATGLSLRLQGGSGDADLVTRSRIPPVCQVFEEFVSPRCYVERGSFFFGTRESLDISAPPAGDYYVNVTSATGYAGATLTTTMSVIPTLTVTRNEIRFTMFEGDAVPAAQTVGIANPSGSTFNWEATVLPATATWLKVDKASGAGDGSISVSVSPAGLAAGTHTASIRVTGAGLGQSPQTINVTFVISRRPAINASTAQMNFTGAPGQNPPAQTLEFTNGGGGTLEWTATAATASGGNWLAVDQPRGTGNARLQITARAGTLAPGVYDGTITLAATGAPNVVVRVRYTIAVLLTANEESLRGLAALLPGRPVSPGDVLVLQGSNFAEPCSVEPQGANPCPRGETFPLPVELAGTSVTVNGTAAPLFLVTPTEVRFLVPFEVSGSEASVVVRRQGGSTAPVVRSLVNQTPGVFSALDNGAGAAKMYHANGSLVSRSSPLAAEEEVTILMSGLGAVSPAVATGAAAPADPLAAAVATPKVFLDGIDTEVISAVLEPGAAGIYRVKIKVPASLPRKYPVFVVETPTGGSNEVSAGGPSLLDVAPATVPKGADAVVTLRGINLPSAAAVTVGGQTLTATVSDGVLQTIRVTIPAALLEAEGELALQAMDTEATAEAASNPVTIRVR